ncbi:hypothetical protein PAPYR_4008 [Paratrimastix pyriformis]|uniref:Uncharacterized protein n=1 Tax=Paratrimastix pyriformis TaxID=342808 RepID=A0ABQ8UL60_9EUKA|nr:hypothetical protein PAPYR_4008 [Paratrimastix pyriformis]
MNPVDQLVQVIFADLERDVAESVLAMYANNIGAATQVLKEMGYQSVGCPAPEMRMNPVDRLVALFANLTSDIANEILKVNEGRLGASIRMLKEMMYKGRDPADDVVAGAVTEAIEQVVPLPIDPEPESPYSRTARALVGLLQSWEVISRPTVLADLLRALTAMCNPNLEGFSEREAALRNAGVAVTLVQQLKDHPDMPTAHPAVAEQLLRAIGSLPRYISGGRATFGRVGAPASLVQLLKEHRPAHHPPRRG